MGKRDSFNEDEATGAMPGLVPELRPFAAEVSAAIQQQDNASLREIIERSGLEWLDPPLPDRYRTGIPDHCRKT